MEYFLKDSISFSFTNPSQMCLYFSKQGLCSWMEVNQFNGNLMAPGNTTKHQPDVVNVAWGLPGSAEAVGFKSVSLDHLQQPRHAQNQPQGEPGKQNRPGASQSQEGRDRREGKTKQFCSCSSGHLFPFLLLFLNLDLHYACTCPACPYSTSPSTFEFLRTRQSVSSPPCSGTVCQLLPDTEPSSTSAPGARSSSQQQREDTCRGSFHSCPRLLSPQDSTDSPFSHTHHHFHHHHCPLTSCLPCPRFVRSHVPHVSCLCCQHSLAACSRESPQDTDTRPQGEKGRAVGNTSQLHPCMHCSASFSRPYQLLQHQRSEHAHKPSGFLCTECGRSFNSHSNLRIHLNVHTGARPYSCPDCGKSFSQSGALKIHRRIHTGERPYSCEFCSRTFPHLSAVRTHERIHTGEKPYHCSQCGKCFTQSGSLKIHTHRVHRGERPFVCSICGKCFSYQSGMSFHYRTAHGLVVQHVGEAGAGRASQRTSHPLYPSGPPGNFPSATLGWNPPDNSESSTHATVSRDSPGLPSVAGLSRRESNPPPDNADQGSRARLVYTCEDCGLQFKDAPSRNKHQILIHYISENSEDDDGQTKTTEKPGDNSGEYTK